MLENKKEGRTENRELSGRVDWIIVPSFLLLYLVNLYTCTLCHCKPSLLTSSTKVGFGDMNFFDNGLREVTYAILGHRIFLFAA